MRKTAIVLAGTAALALALSACGSSDPLAEDPGAGDGGGAGEGDTIVVGSQAYPSNEIIAEIYAQALENAGFEVDRQFSIGQRDAYLPSLESGEIGLFPEYTGNLLQHFDEDTPARAAEEVYTALTEALPESLVALDYAAATDQDSYTVTAEFAAEHDLSTIADLADVDVPLTLGGPPELEERPYGPRGAAEVYGLDLAFSATSETTVEALLAGTIQVGNVYTSAPQIETQNLVPLDDPEGLFLASHVVPIASADVADDIADTINAVSAELTPEALVTMNVQNTEEAMQAEAIATEWLASVGLS